MTGLYGCSSRPAVSQTEFLFSIPAAQSINHIVVFLLPTTQLPPEYAATVYFQWPGKAFQLLGGLSAEKQSAIFRLKGTAGHGVAGSGVTARTNSSDTMVDESDAFNYSGGIAGEDLTAQLGISIEPIELVRQKLMALPAHLSSLTNTSQQQVGGLISRPSPQPIRTAASRPDIPKLARKIIENAFNYLGSFSSGPPGSEVVPMREFQSWWNKFERKLAVDASFLEKEDV
ncbi:hypothetical protein TWF694_009966 [Orbilia ellipsospora]|uniref:Hikeshi-like domain-containing protein n=1 Tax=Orbilia ellipsospora TaxID=2528407 RepID=A0AAV9XCY4_9PEZI